MDEFSVPQNDGQFRSNIGEMSYSVGGNKQPDEESNRPQYSMPGILHFLQTEWARFEMERSQWDVEKAELQARIAFLQGERKGQENLKQDLVRRIKMLEFALKQERAKFHKLKYGTDLCQGDMKSPVYVKEDKDDALDGEVMNMANSNATWRQGRQLLRQYLQEIGYTDTIIDVRSARVRQLLGLQPLSDATDAARPPLVNGDAAPPGKRPNDAQGHRTPNKKMPTSMAESALIDSEASVLATFNFLAGEAVVGDDDDDDDNLSDGEEGGTPEDDERLERKPKVAVAQGNESMAGMDELVASADTDEAMAEFDFLVSEGGEGAGEARSQGDHAEWAKKDLSVNDEWGVDQQLIAKLKEQYKKERPKGKKDMQRPKRSTLQAMLVKLEGSDEMPALQSGSSTPPPRGGATDADELEDPGYVVKTVVGVPTGEDDNMEAVYGLGDLADLTVNNEADPLSYNIASTEQAFRNTWNAKYTLRSHFDGVRALAFHPVEPVLLTASEDHTLKLWNLQKTVPTKKTASLDVEPVYTFRAHTAPVLCLAVSPSGEHCYSGGLDATIRCWRVPSSNLDPYDSFDASVAQDVLTAHTDAVWSLAMHSSGTRLLSCSSDATVRLWDPTSKTPLLNTFRIDDETGLPTSVDFVRCEPNQMVVSYTSANTYVFDIETATQVVRLESKQGSDGQPGSQVNQVISHPTLPLSITAHEDRHIRFFDNNTGKMVHSMVAHLEAVTCLAIDPNGLYLLSGSHDSSIRLWNVDNKTCVQEITSHRKKFDESIHAVAFHPSEPFIASAGADALAKVFV